MVNVPTTFRRIIAIFFALALSCTFGERIEAAGSPGETAISAAKFKVEVALAAPDHGGKVQPSYCPAKSKTGFVLLAPFRDDQTSNLGFQIVQSDRIAAISFRPSNLVGIVELRI